MNRTRITIDFDTAHNATRFYRVLSALIAGKCGLRSICVSLHDIAREASAKINIQDHEQ